MAYPPDNDPTRPQGGQYHADPNANTLPIVPRRPSPPPFPLPYVNQAGSPDPYVIGAPPPILPPPRRTRSATPSIALGVISAFLVVALVLLGVAYAQGWIPGFNALLSATTPTATPAPTVMPSPTNLPSPTSQPTATIPPTATILPTATATAIPTPTATPNIETTVYTYRAPSGIWSLNVPSTVTATPGTYTILGTPVKDVHFDLHAKRDLTVYELPTPLSADAAQAIFMGIIAASGATDVTIIQQPTQVAIGTNLWTKTVIAGTIQGERMETGILAASHGTGSIAISGVTTATAFDATDAQIFVPIEQSFFYLQ